MESTGLRDRIHISQQTADKLEEAGKGHWFRPRSDPVLAKGKGFMQTYWLTHGDDLPFASQQFSLPPPESAPSAASTLPRSLTARTASIDTSSTDAFQEEFEGIVYV